MYEATQTDFSPQLVRIPAATSWLDPFPQQADPTMQIPGCRRRTTDQTTESKEVPTWIRLQRG